MPPRRVWIDKGDGSRFHLVCAGRFCAIFVLAICLAGCEQRSQELEERVTQLQKELNRTQDELRSTKKTLDATNDELARLKAASNSASATSPAPATVAEERPDSAPSASGNSPASGQRPVVSAMPADRSVTIQWPDSGRAPVSANQNAPAPARGNTAGAVPRQSGASAPGAASNRTVVIQWPNNNGAAPATSPASAPSTNPASAPSGAANPPARSVQQPASSTTGRSDRTVIIQWPDSGQSPPPRN
jgi:hypothetical protein